MAETEKKTTGKKNPPKRIKILSVGEAGVGKSCLIKRYCENRFVGEYVATIGIDYGVKSVLVGDLEVKVNFWDTAGDAVFYEIRNEFYRDTQGVMLVYDVTSSESFEKLGKWVDELYTFCGNEKELVIFVVGNKNDIQKREVIEGDAREWAQSQGYPYFETSAQSGEGVVEMFSALFSRVVQGGRA